MMILLVGTHLYLTIRLRCPQRHILKAIKMSVQNDKGAQGDVSQFASLATSLSATIGTGNIIGVATAVCLGGPGAVFWCWFVGILGIATKYGEGLLAVKYRVKTKTGTMLGGPMYALERGMGQKWLAVLFCVFCAIATFGIGNMVQANAIVTTLTSNYGINSGLICAIITGLLALVLLGGVKSISRVCTAMLPFMAALYLMGCFYLLWISSDFVWPAIKTIVACAFSNSAIGGGFAGATVIMALRFGVARGLFSNESGLGSAPIIAAAAKTHNHVRQALVSSTATFWDTVVICAITGITLVSSMLHYPELAADTNGGTLTIRTFNIIGSWGEIILSVSIVAFAFSTLVGWSYYGERCMEYLGGKRTIVPYRVVYILTAIIGCNAQLTVVWNFSDMFNALMAIPNLISLLFLSKVIVDETRKHGYL